MWPGGGRAGGARARGVPGRAAGAGAGARKGPRRRAPPRGGARPHRCSHNLQSTDIFATSAARGRGGGLLAAAGAAASPPGGAAADDKAYPPRGVGVPRVELKGMFSSSRESVVAYIDARWILYLFTGRIFAAVKEFFACLRRGRFLETFVALWVTLGPGRHTQILDARELEERSGLSKPGFFKKYGFVLLKRPSAMCQEDWEASHRNVYETDDIEGQGERWYNKDTPAKRVYAKEAESMLADLLPGARFLPPGQGILRSATSDKRTASVVHCDFGLSLEDFSATPRFAFGDQIAAMEQDSRCKGYMLINLWRTVEPMSRALRWRPLCVLDPNTVETSELVTIDSTENGASTALKSSPKNRWYAYWDMTPDEVLVFKQFHYVRGEPEGRVPVFHSAFEDPLTRRGVERRSSFEYRVGALL